MNCELMNWTPELGLRLHVHTAVPKNDWSFVEPGEQIQILFWGLLKWRKPWPAGPGSCFCLRPVVWQGRSSHLRGLPCLYPQNCSEDAHLVGLSGQTYKHLWDFSWQSKDRNAMDVWARLQRALRPARVEHATISWDPFSLSWYQVPSLLTL